MVFENTSNGSYEAGSNQGSSSSSQQKVDEKKPCMSIRFYLTRHFQDLQNKMEKTTVVGYMKARFPNDAYCPLFASDNDSEKFLAILQGETDETLELFVEALEKTSQNHLASLLRGKEHAIDDSQSSNCEPGTTWQEGSHETENPSSTIASKGQKRKDELLVKVSLQGSTNPGSKEADRLNEGEVIKVLNNSDLLAGLSSFLTDKTGIPLTVAGWSPGSIILHLKLATNEDRHKIKNLCDSGLIGRLLKQFFIDKGIIKTRDLQSTDLDATILEKADGTAYVQLSLPDSTLQKDEPEEKKRKQMHLEATEEDSQHQTPSSKGSDTSFPATSDRNSSAGPINPLAEQLRPHVTGSTILAEDADSTSDHYPVSILLDLPMGDFPEREPPGNLPNFPQADWKNGSAKGSAQDNILSESHDKQYQGSSSGGSVPSSPAAHDQRDSEWSSDSPVLSSEVLVALVTCNI